MRYGFVKLKNCDGVDLYMEVLDYERYSKYDVFLTSAVSLVVYDKIYVASFPLMFKLDEILEYNDDASIVAELPFTDIAFRVSSVSSVAKNYDCVNAF